MAIKGTGTIRSETQTNIQTNVNNEISGDDVQESIVDSLDSISQDLYDDTIPYEAGESVIFEDGGIKYNYLCLAGTTPTESPSTTPAKWEKVSGVGSGVMQIVKAEILYTNISQTTIITLPEDAVIWNIALEVTTQFNDSGTDLLDVGLTVQGDRYINDANISNTFFEQTVGSGISNSHVFVNAVNFTSGIISDKMSTSRNVSFQYTGQNADATQGVANIYIHYSLH
jgi:hypothetical protein